MQSIKELMDTIGVGPAAYARETGEIKMLGDMSVSQCEKPADLCDERSTLARDLGRRFRAGATFMGGTDKAPPTKEIAAAEGIGGRR